MSDPAQDDARPGRWARLWRAPRSRWLLGIPLGGLLAFVAGLVFTGGFVAAVEMTNTEGFCISCHEMRDNVYLEYQGTIHHSNRTGVRATCADCHVPKAWVPKMQRKIVATFKELPGHFLGTLDTPEKFEAHRERLAQNVWTTMKANDSRECRNCHELDHMDFEAQDKSARKKHTMEVWKDKGETCIDCHKGIAHRLPEVALDDSATP